MPELPEVETIKRDLEKRVAGQKISQVKVWDGRVIRNANPRAFIKKLQGQRIVKISRAGKAVIFNFSNKEFLTVQPMMAGYLLYQKKCDLAQRPSSAKVTFLLSSGNCLHYNDHRMFGRLNLIGDLNKLPFFAVLGLDPLSKKFTTTWLKNALSKRKTPVKPLLMEQNLIAGIGNIYASEILFRCGILPQRPANSLSAEEIGDIRKHTRIVLKEAIRYRGTSADAYRDIYGRKGNYVPRLRVYDRAKEKCLRCGAPIQRIVQAGRSTFFCQVCQK